MNTKSREDNIFAEDVSAHDFSFDQKVAKVFDDMLSRSVPLYADSQRMALELAHKFARPSSNVYDIGCSTGTLLSAFSKMISEKTSTS